MPKKAAKKKTPKRAAKREAAKDDSMVTIAVRGRDADAIKAFMRKHSIKGAQLLREAFEVYAEAVKAGEVVPGGEEEEEEEEEE